MTTPELTGKLHLEGDVNCYSGNWTLRGETLEWELEGKSYRIESDDDLSKNVSSFVKVLGEKVLYENVELRGCMTCKHFAMSGMARDMGRGQRGVCSFHQRRVEVCFVCADYATKKEG